MNNSTFSAPYKQLPWLSCQAVDLRYHSVRMMHQLSDNLTMCTCTEGTRAAAGTHWMLYDHELCMRIMHNPLTEPLLQRPAACQKLE